MFKRSLMSLLLFASIVTATMGRPVVRQKESSDQAKKESLTPDEEREARALAEEFIDRLEKSGDVSPLVKDLYVDDFPDSLRSHMDTLFPLVVTPEVAAQMSSEEMLRTYAASINLMCALTRLFIEGERRREQEKARGDWAADKDENKDPKLSELIPPNVVSLIRSDPWLAAMLDELIADENDENQINGGERDTGNASTSEANVNEADSARKSMEVIWPFKSLDQVLHYTSVVEESVKLLREHFDSLPAELKPSLKEFMSVSRDRSNDEETNEPADELDIYPHVLSTDWMGYSAGTHIICAKVLIFHMDMVRADDGHLKVLNAYLMID